MAEKKTEQEKLDEEAKNLTDLEIAELANKELRKKDEELIRVRKELARAKLYSVAEDEESEILSREECVKRLGSNRTTNYDYAEAVVNLVELEKSEGKPNPLGKNGEEVYTFFKDVIEECGDDKSQFTSVYQSRLGKDDPQISAAYNSRKEQ